MTFPSTLHPPGPLLHTPLDIYHDNLTLNIHRFRRYSVAPASRLRRSPSATSSRRPRERSRPTALHDPAGGVETEGSGTRGHWSEHRGFSPPRSRGALAGWGWSTGVGDHPNRPPQYHKRSTILRRDTGTDVRGNVRPLVAGPLDRARWILAA